MVLLLLREAAVTTPQWPPCVPSPVQFVPCSHRAPSAPRVRIEPVSVLMHLQLCVLVLRPGTDRPGEWLPSTQLSSAQGLGLECSVYHSLALTALFTLGSFAVV